MKLDRAKFAAFEGYIDTQLSYKFAAPTPTGGSGRSLLSDYSVEEQKEYLGTIMKIV